MPYPRPRYPSQIWDGLTNNIDRVDTNSNVNPNAEDWERIAAEVISMQQQGVSSPTVVTGDITIGRDSSGVLIVDASTGAINIILEAASLLNGRQFIIKKIDATVNAVTIDPEGSETIDGELTQVINTQYVSITILSDGTEWFIL